MSVPGVGPGTGHGRCLVVDRLRDPEATSGRLASLQSLVHSPVGGRPGGVVVFPTSLSKIQVGSSSFFVSRSPRGPRGLSPRFPLPLCHLVFGVIVSEQDPKCPEQECVGTFIRPANGRADLVYVLRPSEEELL